eukprot:m.114452 g.114452  ORF g.114452 m.114452 type:complete len:1152 (-) comp14167_c0_seq1:6-3461(-)
MPVSVFLLLLGAFVLPLSNTHVAAVPMTVLDDSCEIYGLWPKPVYCDANGSDNIQLSEHFSVNVTGVPGHSPMVTQIVQRFLALIRVNVSHKTRGPIEPHLGIPNDDSEEIKSGSQKILDTLQVHITDSSRETTKSVNSKENYTLTIDWKHSLLTAPSIWGVQYGLETFSQLIRVNGSLMTISRAPITIRDAPQYPWRGFMLDTSNHFIPVDAIKRTLDAMAYNRMNVFHWHIVDSYSFPFVSESIPELSKHGKWSPSSVYTKTDVKTIVSYGNLLGIRVIPELDAPGHGYSFGLAIPDMVVPCEHVNTGSDIGPVNVVPLNPIENKTYEVLQALVEELTIIFADKFFHVGGDELQYACWQADPVISNFMKEHKESVVDLQARFEQQYLRIVGKQQKRPIVWADTFQQVPSVLGKDVVVEIWDNLTLLDEAIKAGHDAILALGWYLDRQVPVDNATHWFWLDTWADMYMVDPVNMKNGSGYGTVLGGEANMWTEQVDASSLNARVWPRTCAVAERLWSPIPGASRNASNSADKTILESAATRLAYHRCRMSSRGIPVGPIWSDSCNENEGSQQERWSKITQFSQQNISCVTNSHSGANATSIVCSHRPNKNDHSQEQSENSYTNTMGTWACVCWAVMSFALWFHFYSLQQRRKRQEGAQTSAPETTLLIESHIQDEKVVLKESERKGVPLKERVKALDVFRGMNIALMVFVDMTGADFPEIHHSPWNGIRLADFVMPFFDFMVGVSLAISLKKFGMHGTGRKWEAFKKATIRFLKLFIVGVITQGGISCIEFNLAKVRVMGILQRVAVCYYFVAIMEIFLPRNMAMSSSSEPGPGSLSRVLTSIGRMLRKFSYHWLIAAILLGAHSGIIYGVNVPPAYGFECGRGVLTPVCNAATYVDKMVFGVDHMYYPANGGDSSGNDVTYQRLPECSSCSPGKCRKDDRPEWCDKAPFDPEGLVSSLNAILTTIIGCHYGHVLQAVKIKSLQQEHFFVFSVLQLVGGFALHFSGAILMNTDLYSLSYVLVTGGSAGLALALCYQLVDINKVGARLWKPFMYFGMNAITMYLLAEGDVIDTFLGLIYWDKTNSTQPPYNNDKNLQNVLWPTGVYWGDVDYPLPSKPTHNRFVMIWTILYISFWMVVSWGMFLHNIFIKI